MPAAQTYAAIEQQDGLRSVRNFISLLSGAVNDQSWAGQDGYVINPPGQFNVQGQVGIAVEGKPVIVANAEGQASGTSPVVWLVGAFLLYKLLS